MKKLMVILLLAMVVGIVPSLAAAISLPAGPVEFKFTDYTYLDPFDPDDPTFLLGDDGIEGSTDPTLDRELRWIGACDMIKEPGIGGDIIWTPSPGEELTFIASGLILTQYVAPGGIPTGYYDASAGGAQLDLYLDTSPDFNASGGPSLFGPPRGNRTYPTVTDPLADDPGNSLWLSTQFLPWRDVTDANQNAGQADVYKTTVISSINGVGGPGYVEITGGSAADYFIRGIGITPGDGTFGGVPYDINFVAPNLHFIPQIGEPPWDTWGWTSDSHDPALAMVIPEPCTMLLLGSGMLGFAAFGRRKKFKSKQS